MTLNEPANTVVVSATPATSIREMYIETVANMYPKRLVTAGTDSNDMAVCGADGLPLGVLGWEDCNDAWKPSTISTIYVVLDRAPVISGPGTVVQLSLAISQTIVVGDRLIPLANGTVGKADVLITDSGSTAVTSTAADGAIITGDIGDATVVAIAMEAVTTGGGAGADIMAKLLI